MASEGEHPPNVQLQMAIGQLIEQPDLELDQLVVFYQDVNGTYGVLSSCCCATHRVALMAAGMYRLEDCPPYGADTRPDA